MDGRMLRTGCKAPRISDAPTPLHGSRCLVSRTQHTRRAPSPCWAATVSDIASLTELSSAPAAIGAVVPMPVASPPAAAAAGACQAMVVMPEDLKLEPGQLSTVNRTSPEEPQDVFRCYGCTELACQTPRGCAPTAWRFQTDGYLRAILTARVYDVAIQSPLEEAKKLSSRLGNTILLKREDLQPVFSFKLRGAFNKMVQLGKAALAERGVITASAGNHAQGVALAASRLGCRAVICMPTSTPEIKIENVRKLGGIVELVGAQFSDTQIYAVARAAREGLAYISPYDDPLVIAGQGTIGDEIFSQMSDPDSLDAVFVPVGGGGLIAGIAAYIKALRPNILVIGVEPTGANAMAQSLQHGKRIALGKVDAFADGVAVRQVGAETFRMCRQLVDGVVQVDNGATSAAIKDVFNETRSILEPAGALAVAGAKAWLKREGHKGKTVVAVTSGANINFERLRLVAELANVGGFTEATMATTMSETPGSFARFMDVATGGDGTNGASSSGNGGNGSSARDSISVTEFKYRYSAGPQAQVLWGASIRSPQELADLLARLQAAGFPTVDLSNVEVAQLHLRHLVGGRARSFTGCITNERIYQVIFPETPGALRRFLAVVSPRWNLTLFHYQNTGNRESSVLIGVQVAPHEEAAFLQAVSVLDSFVFAGLDGAVRDVFDMFIQ